LTTTITYSGKAPTWIIPDLSLPTFEAPPAILYLVDNNGSVDESYLECTQYITAGHSAQWPRSILKQPTQYLADLPDLSTLNHLKQMVAPHEALELTVQRLHQAGYENFIGYVRSLSYQLHFGPTSNQYQFQYPA